jgi:hypothetical protein
MSESSSRLNKRGGCLLFFLSILALFQIVFAFRVLEDSTMYGEILISPFIHVGMSLAWLVIILWAAYAVLRKKAYELGVYTIIAYLVFRLLQVMFFAGADYDRNRIPFLLLVMLFLLLIPLLRWLWRSGKYIQRG